MPTYILLTSILDTLPNGQESYLKLNDAVKAQIDSQCSGVNWVSNFAISGPYDYLDIFEAPDNETATQVALIVRATGNAQTEVWNATRWENFKSLILESKSKREDPAQKSRRKQKSKNRVDVAGRESFPASDPPSWTSTRKKVK